MTATYAQLLSAIEDMAPVSRTSLFARMAEMGANLPETRKLIQLAFERGDIGLELDMRISRTKEKQCRCDKCNAVIELDVHVPDEIWKRISPKPIDGYKGGGLLCPQCVVDALTRPSEQAVTEAHKLLLWAADSFEAHAKTADALYEIDGYLGSAKMYREAAFALKAAMEAGR